MKAHIQAIHTIPLCWSYLDISNWPSSSLVLLLRRPYLYGKFGGHSHFVGSYSQCSVVSIFILCSQLIFLVFLFSIQPQVISKLMTFPVHGFSPQFIISQSIDASLYLSQLIDVI